MALETEMARLDDARVHRPDGHLVDLVAFHAEEVGHARQDRGVVRAAPGVVPGPVGRDGTGSA